MSEGFAVASGTVGGGGGGGDSSAEEGDGSTSDGEEGGGSESDVEYDEVRLSLAACACCQVCPVLCPINAGTPF